MIVDAQKLQSTSWSTPLRTVSKVDQDQHDKNTPGARFMARSTLTYFSSARCNAILLSLAASTARWWFWLAVTHSYSKVIPPSDFDFPCFGHFCASGLSPPEVVSDGFALIIGSVEVIVSGVLLWWLVFLELPQLLNSSPHCLWKCSAYKNSYWQ